MADIRVARKENSRLVYQKWLKESLQALGGLLVCQIVGKAKAMEIMVTGRKFSFEESREMDLARHIRLDDPRRVPSRCSRLCGTVYTARHDKAIGNIKRSVQSGLEIPLEYHLALEKLQSDLFQSNDAKEGIKAYVETKTQDLKETDTEFDVSFDIPVIRAGGIADTEIVRVTVKTLSLG